MDFPKQLMTIKELEQMGFSAKLLRKLAAEQGSKVCIREGGKTSAIKFDTQAMYSYIVKRSRMLERG